MRPIKLKMTAFGPYKDTEVIDFTELEENLLFVVSGATGSGKTSIFDAICFALYGFASGEERSDVSSLRSHFADDNVQTEVELTFDMKGRTYRIMRQIAYVKKGNKSPTQANCSFYELTAEGESQVVDRQIVSEINPKVVDILGLTRDQFIQIVMLPQGEFRKFLTSSTENKELIMRKIFKTDQYVTLVSRLKQQRDEAKSHFDTEKQQEKMLIEQIPASIPFRESSIFTVLANEHANTNQIVTALKEEGLFYEEKIEADKNQYQSSYDQHRQKLQQFHQAEAVNERFRELAEKQQIYLDMSNNVTAMKKKADQLEGAEKAVLIEQIERQFNEATKDYQLKEEQLKVASNQLKEAEQGLEKVRTLYEVEEKKQPELEKIKEQLFRLQDALPKVKDLASKKEERSQLKMTASHNIKKLKEIEQTLVEKKQQAEKMTSELEEKEEAVHTLDDQLDALSLINEKCTLIDEYIKHSDQTIAYEKEQERLLREFEQAKESYDSFASKWIQGEAALLAAELHDGEACPVCGSKEHPNKAHGKNETISKEQLEDEKERLTTFENAYRMAVANFQSSSKQLEEKAELVRSKELKVEKIREEKETVKKEQETLQKNVQELRALRQQIVEDKAKIKEETDKVTLLQTEHSSLEKTIFETTAAIQTIDALIDQTTATIPEEWIELSVLKEKLSELESQKIAMERAWKDIQQQLDTQRQNLTTAKSNEQHAKSSFQESENKKELMENRFEEALEKSMFKTRKVYEESKMDEVERASLKDEIERFRQRYYSIREDIVALQEQLKDKEQVDLNALNEVLHKLKADYEKALEALNQSKSRYEGIGKLIGQLEGVIANIQKYEQKFSKIEDLYDMIRGKNHMRLSFERYIQIEYLEQMIQSANERLRELSNGQFELMRSDRQEGHGRQSGLGLDVYDAYTGQTRDVKTLSGGEKFNAALCLALGMADIIQSFQGAVSIDTMFIDEGFGTLDEESLAKSIDTLIDLQKAGRMIGVISHVEELKAALPATLQVTKKKGGYSETKFILK